MPQRQRYDWPTLINEFKQSGLSQSAFCQQRGLSLSSFNTQLHRQDVTPKASPFVRLEQEVDVAKPKPSPKHDEQRITLEIGACKIHWPSALPMASLANLVKQLS